jgi:hypothetical protein
MRYAIWEQKPEFLRPGIVMATMYAVYGYGPTNYDQWVLLGPSAEPDHRVAMEVRSKGFCLRELSEKDSERMKRMYKQTA